MGSLIVIGRWWLFGGVAIGRWWLFGGVVIGTYLCDS